MNDKVLNLLGLAKRARKIVTGEDAVLMELRKQNLQIVFVANDSSAKTIDNFERKCFFYHCLLNKDYSSSELSHAIGQNRKIIGVIDEGFSKEMIKNIRG